MLQKFRKLSFLVLHKRFLMILGLVLLTSIIFPEVVDAQGGLKISSLTDVEEKAKEGSDTIVNIGKYVLAAVLVVTLVYVIYAVSSNQPHAKEMAFGWIIAVIIIMVAFLII